MPKQKKIFGVLVYNDKLATKTESRFRMWGPMRKFRITRRKP